MALIVVTVVTAVPTTPAKKAKLKNVEVEVLVGLRGGEAPQTICREHGVVCAVDSKHHDLPGGDGDFWLPFEDEITHWIPTKKSALPPANGSTLLRASVLIIAVDGSPRMPRG